MLIALLRRFLVQARWVLVGIACLQLVQTLATLYLPRLSADIIDKGITRGDSGYIWSRGLIMLGATGVQVIFAIGAIYYGSRTAMRFGRDVRAALFERVSELSVQDVSRTGAASLISRITNDVQQVQILVLTSCTLLLGAPIMVVGGTVLALREDVGVSVVLLVAIPVLIIAIGILVTNLVPRFRTMQVQIDAVNQVLREQITGMRVVRAFVRERQETERFRTVNGELTKVAIGTGRLLAMMFPIVTVVLNLSFVGVLFVGAGRIDDGHMSIGTLVAFLTYLAQILAAVMMATFMAVMVPRAAVSAERILQVLETAPSLAISDHPVVSLPSRASLEFRNVSYLYPGAEHAVLSDITFRCGPGTTTAIVGSTGAGKTTLISLIPRLFDVSSGAVFVDGCDVRDIDHEVLSARIGYVPQRPYLFTGTVASNLRFGRADATDDQLWASLDIAQASGFVNAMDGGLDAAITQGGSNVSGGQRQRLSIARALVRQPEIYVFDDSFSALDLTTDARLRAALAPHTTDAAVLVVAQRVSTVMTADQIVVLDDGAMVGIGTHDQLLDTCSTYVEIVASQLTKEALQ